MSNNKLDENFVNSTLPAPLSADLRSRVCFTVAEVAELLGVPVGEVRCKVKVRRIHIMIAKTSEN